MSRIKCRLRLSGVPSARNIGTREVSTGKIKAYLPFNINTGILTRDAKLTSSTSGRSPLPELRFPHPAPLGGSSAFIANTGWVTCRDESFAFFTFAFPWRATAVPCFFGYVIQFTSGRDQRPPPGIPPPTLRFSLSSSPESVPVHDIFISWPPT